MIISQAVIRYDFLWFHFTIPCYPCMTRVGRQNDTCGLAVLQAANEFNIILFLEQDKVF